MRMSKFWLALSTVTLLAMPLASGARAAAAVQPQVITITPTSSDIDVTPGKVTHGSFQVLNQGQTDYDFTVYASAYSAKGESYTPDFNKLPGAVDVASWFKFSATKGHIKPADNVTIGYDIAVPAGTLPGDYYAAAFAQTKTTAAKGSSVILNERVGELFYMRVPGNEVRKGSVAGWNASFLQEKPLTATVRVADEGSTHFTATIQVIARDIFGRPKYTLTTNKVILPQSVRKLTVKWDKSPSFGIFKVTGSVNYLNKTDNLPTRYVLIVSKPVRFTVGPLLLLLVCLLIWSLTQSAFRKRKQPKKSKK